MKYIIFLNGDFIPLAIEEFKSVVKKQGASMKILNEYSSRLMVIELSKHIKFSDLALTHEVSILLGDVESCNDIDWKKKIDGTAAVRSRKIPGNYFCESRIIEKRIGASLYEAGIKIDLDNADCNIIAYLSPDAHLLGMQIFSSSENRFSDRRPDLRPFCRPISLDPKIARSMVNLARASAGDSVADPFVGTGGLLIEAGLINCRVFGMDLESQMVEGTIKNLEHFRIKSYKLKVGDAFDLRSMFGETFDAIVTDLPYSKNTKTIDSKKVAEKFIEYIPSVLNNSGYACIASNHSDLMIPSTLDLVFRYELVLHASLSKHIYVLRNK